MPAPILPVEECLDQLRQRLLERDEALLEAPPGAGKTTLVPLALLDEEWLRGRKILMLEPRRIAARAAAWRMSSLLGEAPGGTVGYRMRLESRIGARTRIEIITEGILVRMLQQDPALSGVGMVIFDEFHERNLDSDLALALCLQGREWFRGETDGGDAQLKILIMSATLDGAALAALLDDAPIVRSEGRTYPVDIVYGSARQARDGIVERMVAAVRQALAAHPGSSLLAFLPGQGEIRRADEMLRQWLLDTGQPDIHLRPLYGNLSIEEQQRAIAPLSGREKNDRKVVLATNIAETSLTIEGVDVIVDSGLVREARFNPATGMTALHTVSISAASSAQRAGRAGRLGPGTCYRLWSEEQQRQLAEQTPAEILKADLAPLALQLLEWGIDDPEALRWLDPPPRGHWSQALDLLQALGAIETRNGGRVLSAHGRAMSALPLHPRLAQLLLRGAEAGHARAASLLASLLSERDPLSAENPDIGQRLELLSGDTGCPPQHRAWAGRTRQLALQLQQRVKARGPQSVSPAALLQAHQLPGFLVACAYPDRIARRRHSGAYQLANGRSASFAGDFYIGKNRWLAVAEVSGVAGGRGDVIRSAAALDEQLFETLLRDQVHAASVAEWDRRSGRFVAETRQQIGALVWRKQKLEQVPPEARRAALIRYLRERRLEPLNWTPGLEQWCARVSLLRSLEPDAGWPDVSRDALLAALEDWLGPYLDAVTTLQGFRQLDLERILGALLPWELQQRLEQLAPPKFRVPSGSKLAIDYSRSPPVLAVKLQEMFGCEQTPTIANGKVGLVVHLLSPAGRPLQITQDLAGFWRSSYHDVKREMKGRYPKHPWPDDPLSAVATRKTRNRT